jgi:hypothetical protein
MKLSEFCTSSYDCPEGCTCENGQCLSNNYTAYNSGGMITTPSPYSTLGGNGTGYNGNLHNILTPNGLRTYSGNGGYSGPTIKPAGIINDMTKLNRLYFNNSILNTIYNNDKINILYTKYKDLGFDQDQFSNMVSYISKLYGINSETFLISNYFKGQYIKDSNHVSVHYTIMNLYNGILNYMFGVMKVIDTQEYDKYKEMLNSTDSTNINMILEIMENTYNKNYYNEVI